MNRSGKPLVIVEPQILPVDVSTLNVPQLVQLKNQLEQDIELFQESLANLKLAQAKFQESKECVEKVKPEHEGRKMLVPLTGSIYVEGKMKEPENLLIDIGTGYYVEMNPKDAGDYFERKITYVTQEMEKIQKIGSEKNRGKAVVMEMLQYRLQQAPNQITKPAS